MRKIITSKTCSPAACWAVSSWPRRSSSLIVLPSPAHHIVAGWQVHRVSHNTLAIRTASLSSSFGNKPYCEPKITPNPAFLTHPVLSWNHSPQNEYKGDSCRVVALQLWKMCSIIVAWTSWCVPLNTLSPSVPFTSLAYFLAEVLLTPPIFRGKTPYKSSPQLAPLGM